MPLDFHASRPMNPANLISPVAGVTLDTIIAMVENSDDRTWGVDVVRSADGKQNCFFGHLFNMGANDAESNLLWNWFEQNWSSTYVIYPVNDGSNPAYPEAAPRLRVLAYLRALRNGDELTTTESMSAEYRQSLLREPDQQSARATWAA